MNYSKTDMERRFKKPMREVLELDARQRGDATRMKTKMKLFQEFPQSDEIFRGHRDQKNGHFVGGRGDGMNGVLSSPISFKSVRHRQKKVKGLHSVSIPTNENPKLSPKGQISGFQTKKPSRYSKKRDNRKARLREKRLEKLETEISWIYSESSWSGESDQEQSRSDSSKMMSSTKNLSGHQINVAFRDHVVKELLKQGKDLAWFAKGVRRAVDKIHEVSPKGLPEALKSDANLALELSNSLIKSSGPYNCTAYHEKLATCHKRRKGSI